MQLFPISHGCLNLVNHNNHPVTIGKLERICRVSQSTEAPSTPLIQPGPTTPAQPLKKIGSYSSPVSLNPDGIITPSFDKSFREALDEYDSVFKSIHFRL